MSSYNADSFKDGRAAEMRFILGNDRMPGQRNAENLLPSHIYLAY